MTPTHAPPPTTIAVTATNVQQACAAARRHLVLALRDSREVLRSGGEDGLYRVHLADGTIVEVSCRPRTRAAVQH